MNPWPFVVAAYGVTLGGAALLAALSFLAMRRAERAAERGRASGRERAER